MTPSGQKRSDTLRRKYTEQVIEGLDTMRAANMLPCTLPLVAMMAGVRYHRASMLAIPEVMAAFDDGEILASSRGPMPKDGHSSERMDPRTGKATLIAALKAKYQVPAARDDMDAFIEREVNIAWGTTRTKHLLANIEIQIESHQHVTVGRLESDATVKRLESQVASINERLDNLFRILPSYSGGSGGNGAGRRRARTHDTAAEGDAAAS